MWSIAALAEEDQSTFTTARSNDLGTSTRPTSKQSYEEARNLNAHPACSTPDNLNNTAGDQRPFHGPGEAANGGGIRRGPGPTFVPRGDTTEEEIRGGSHVLCTRNVLDCARRWTVTACDLERNCIRLHHIVGSMISCDIFTLAHTPADKTRGTLQEPD